MDKIVTEYFRNDKKLKESLARAAKLIQKFYAIDYDNNQLKIEILEELFGSIGKGISIEHNFHCDLGNNIYVGENFYAGFNCTILDMSEVRIGNNCLLGPNVGIYTTGHNINPVDRHKTGISKPITIGDNVWIGGHSVLIGGIKIGNNSIIAAGTVVTKDIPENTIYAGNPAKKIKDIIV